jgi:hypothetical protein
VEVEDTTPNPSLLDDGDVEPNPGPINLAQFGEQPTEPMAWIQWFKHHWGPKRDGPDGWITQYCLNFVDMTHNNNVLYRNGQAILNPRDRWNYSQMKKPSRKTGISFSTTSEEPLPPSAYIKPPATLHHHDGRIWWWVNEHVPGDISRTRGTPDANPEYAIPDELMAWHLYEDPLIPEAAIEASDSSSQQQCQGPQSENLDVLRDYV